MYLILCIFMNYKELCLMLCQTYCDHNNTFHVVQPARWESWIQNVIFVSRFCVLRVTSAPIRTAHIMYLSTHN